MRTISQGIAVVNPNDRVADVLLVDRDPGVAQRIMGFLGERRYAVEWVEDGEKAFNLLDTRPFDVLVAELNIRRVDGMRLMAVAKERNPDVCVVFITDQADMELATEAMRQGAYDFQIKPVNLGKLEAVIQRGLAFQRLVYRQHELRRRLDEHYGLGNLVGNSRQMVRVYDAVRRGGPLDGPVLIFGESGTGKDLIAQAIHTNSLRRDEAFVKVACGEGDVERLDRELFGAGASKGMLEVADQGTLYLDEVSALTGAHQAVLIELIRGRRFHRPGDRRVVSANVRVIGSTRIPLEGTGFREELLGLLRSTYIEVPALRDRREDIPLLAQHFLRESSEQHGFAMTDLTRNGLDVLMRYDWPENVRELRNILEGMVVMGRGKRALDVYDVPDYIRAGARGLGREISFPVGTSMAEIERLAIAETMQWCAYNKNACAKALGIGLRTLYRKLKEYDIR